MPPESPSESVAGRYRLEREVGRGGMGSVWLATDERLGRKVALKQVGGLPGQSAPHLARALREARSSAALNHPGVVALYDVLEEGGALWLVMEYVPGRTLSEMVAQEGPLPPERVARIGAQIADGLLAAHRAGTIHRDVKPGNVLVTEDDHAKISDFGIARTLGDDKLTQTGVTTGTPAYFAPELARGEEPTPAADVWALGATLYAAVEGRTPYPERPNALAMLATIADGPPAPPERAGALRGPLGRMLDPDPAARWEMADCAYALHRVVRQSGDGEGTERHPAVPVGARGPSTDEVPTPAAAPPPRSRRRPVLVAALVLLLAGVAGLGLVLSLGDRDSPEPTAGDQPSQEASPSESSSPPEAEPKDEEPTTGEPESSGDEGDGAPAGGARGFVADYYAVLPEDTEAGWAMLAPSFQDEVGSYGDYDGFWSTIDAVTVEGTEPAGPRTVDVTLTYVSDGSSEQEVRRIVLERDRGDYVIVDDEVVG